MGPNLKGLSKTYIRQAVEDSLRRLQTDYIDLYRSKDDLAKRARGTFVEKYLNARGFAIIDALDKVAQDYNMTPAQVALSWLIAHPGITAPIASASNLEQLNELIQAATMELNPSVIDLLNQDSAFNKSGPLQ